MRKDLSLREAVVVAPLIALLLVFGFYPKPLLDVINPAVAATHAGHRQDRPGAVRGATGGRQVNVTAVARGRLHAAEARLRGAGADADPVRRGLRRRAGRGVRAAAQPAHGPVRAVALAALVAALVTVIRDAPAAAAGRSPPTSRWPIDGPTLFLQGTLVVLGIVALLLIAERSLERGGPFVAQAAITVGGEADRRQADGARRRPRSSR